MYPILSDRIPIIDKSKLIKADVERLRAVSCQGRVPWYSDELCRKVRKREADAAEPGAGENDVLFGNHDAARGW